ncbi:peptidoglycan hydrolase CwlO-like protein [Streptomyces ambofaciens]
MTTAAVTVVCAVTVLAAPGTAFADPGPSSSPSPSASADAPAATPDKDLEAVRKKLDALYRAAASATEEYNAAEEKAEQQNTQIVELAKKIVKGQEKLDGLKDRAGAAARAQYRTGGMPDGAKLVLSDDPEDFLDGTGRVIQGQRATKGLLGELTRAQEDLKTYAADASARFKELEANRKAKATSQKKIEKQIAAAEKLESELAKEEKERLARLEKEAQAKAQTAWLDSGILKDLDTGATERGRKAVEYATAQIGKPYQWGAEGPKSYDCSGLTSQGLGVGRADDPSHLAAAVEAAEARRRRGHAPRRPDHLLRRRQPRRHVRRRRIRRARSAPRAFDHHRGRGVDADPRRGPAGHGPGAGVHPQGVTRDTRPAPGA